MGWALACATLGMLLAWAGYRVIRRHEGPVERTGFHTVPWSYTFGYWGGYILLFLGLYLLMIQGPMFWIGRPR